MLTRDDYNGGFHISINNGYGEFSVSTNFSNPGNGLADIGDINSDGRTDISASDSSGNLVRLYYTNPDASLSIPIIFNTGIEASNNSIADFNNDQKNDIVNYDMVKGEISLLSQLDDDLFSLDFLMTGLGKINAYAVGDLNGDKLPDIVIGQNSGAVFIYKNNGDRTISLEKTLQAAGTGDIKSLYIVDLDNDQSPDIVADNWIPSTSFDNLSVFYSSVVDWRFSLANSNFDRSTSIVANTVIGTIAAVKDTGSDAFSYSFSQTEQGTTTTQSLNGYTIDATTGQIKTSTAVSTSTSFYIIAKDGTGAQFATPFSVKMGTRNADILSNDATVVFALGGNDRVTGTAAAEAISGGAGNDTIVDFVGADFVNGGGGKDVLSLSASSEDLTKASDAQIVGIEEISLRSASAPVTLDLRTQTEGFLITGSNYTDSIIGGAGVDTINGGVGNDVLDGGGAADKLAGGKNDDEYIVDLTARGALQDTMIEASNEGTDLITLRGASTNTRASTISLAANVENIDASATGSSLLNFAGNTANNVITGNDAANVITGGRGADRMSGNGGQDTFQFRAGDSGQSATTIDTIVDLKKAALGVGDVIDYNDRLSVGGSNAAASSTQASINKATGVATFAAGSGTSLSDALADIAGRFKAAKDSAGEFALFQLDNSGDYYMFISDGRDGVGANDIVIQLIGVTSIGSIDLTGGNLTITG